MNFGKKASRTTLILLLAALRVLSASAAPPVFDDFSSAKVDSDRWEWLTEEGTGKADAAIKDGSLIITSAPNRAGLATTARIGRKAEVQVDALGYTGTNQILQLTSGEGSHSEFVEFGLEGVDASGKPIVHVWGSNGEGYQGPVALASPVSPEHPVTLRILRDGNHFQYFVNNSRVFEGNSGALDEHARVFLYGFEPSVSRWDDLRISGPPVTLARPEFPTSPKQSLDVRGSVSSGAVSWTLEWAQGPYPVEWFPVANGKGPANGVLGRWTPTPNAAGEIIFRITAVDADGYGRSVWRTVSSGRNAISSPMNGQVVGPAFSVALGNAMPPGARLVVFGNGKLMSEAVEGRGFARIIPNADGPLTLQAVVITPDGKKNYTLPVHVRVQRNLYGRNARPTEQGHAFVFPDGQAGVLIGENDSYTFPALYPLWREGNVESAEEYLRMLRSHGVNVLRMMLESAGRPMEFIENPLGTWNPETLRFWDRFLPLCERHGMTVLITPWDTFWMNQPWTRSPYNRANGGPCATPRDFLTDPTARRLQKQRIAMMIDRWGNSPAIFAIDLLNEFDIWWDAPPRERVAWVRDMAAFTRDYELKKWGHAHMLTVSSAIAEPSGSIGDMVFNYPLFDFANTHLYYRGTVNAPNNTIDPALDMAKGVRYALSQIRDGRPYTDTESGPIDRWVSDESFDNEVHRQMTWAHFAAGGCGTGMRWPYRHPHNLTEGMHRNQRAVAQASNDINLQTFFPCDAGARLHPSKGLLAIGSADRNQAVIWIRSNAETPEGPIRDGSVRMRKMSPGNYRATVWDTTTGIPLARKDIASEDGVLSIPLPPFKVDTAVSVIPATNPISETRPESEKPATKMNDTPFRPPATPLITHDPYFSVWSFSDRLTDGPTRHWTGAPQPICGLVRIDGVTYRYAGSDPEGVPALEQITLDVWPTRTVYVFRGGGIELALSFITPSLPHNLDLLSRPATYVQWSVRSTDGKPHEVKAYLDVTSHIAVNKPDQKVTWGRYRIGDLNAARIGTTEQPILAKAGDDLRIDWGHFYLAQKGGTIHAGSISSRKGFVASGELPGNDDLRERAVADDTPVLACVKSLGTVGSDTVSDFAVLAYDDIYSLEHMQNRLRPYWRRNGADAEELLKTAFADYPALAAQCKAFDEELVLDLTTVGGAKYARLASLAYRQCFAAHKLAAEEDGTPIFFSKENFSNGCINTVDVTYPSSPFFLLFQPELLKAQLGPILDYAASPRWPWAFAPHDLGTYPLANGQVYGGGEKSERNQMPVEECGNMLIMLAALANVEGNSDFSNRHWDTIAGWADYLLAKGLDPENQLCTDDFAGHLAHNANLSAKAIMAIAGFARLCAMTGRNDVARRYEEKAREMAAEWMKIGDDGGHFRLAFDQPGTWSQKYNLVWDSLLGLKIFPKEAVQKETASYSARLRRYGLPLDNRRTYTKTDWQVWTGVLGGSPLLDEIVSRMFDFANETPDRVPFSDWYETTDARKSGFQARSVIGGVYMPLLANPEIAGKWIKQAREMTDTSALN